MPRGTRIARRGVLPSSAEEEWLTLNVDNLTSRELRQGAATLCRGVGMQPFWDPPQTHASCMGPCQEQIPSCDAQHIPFLKPKERIESQGDCWDE